MLYRSFGATLLTTHALKATVREKRPDSDARNSFPSGHTAAAFSGASFIQRRYGWAPGAPAYLLAGYVGYTRVRADAHYPRDVLAGAALATAFTYCLTDPLPGVSARAGIGPHRMEVRLVGAF